jgi:hypothetical protein
MKSSKAVLQVKYQIRKMEYIGFYTKIRINSELVLLQRNYVT